MQLNWDDFRDVNIVHKCTANAVSNVIWKKSDGEKAKVKVKKMGGFILHIQNFKKLVFDLSIFLLKEKYWDERILKGSSVLLGQLKLFRATQN